MIRRWTVFASIAVGALACQSVPAAAPAKPRIITISGYGEVVDLGELPADMYRRVELTFTENDYPPRSIRESHQGLVESWVIVGQDGRVAQVGIVRAPDLAIANVVSGILQRRLKLKFIAWPGRYVRVRLPAIQFRIRDCDGSEALLPREGAPQVVGEKLCRPETVTPESWVTHPAESAGQ